jgi:hypothetical protein
MCHLLVPVQGELWDGRCGFSLGLRRVIVLFSVVQADPCGLRHNSELALGVLPRVWSVKLALWRLGPASHSSDSDVAAIRRSSLH